METIDLGTQAVTNVPTDIAFYNPLEVFGSTYDPGSGDFILTDTNGALASVTAGGVYSLIGPLPASIRGLAFNGGTLYGGKKSGSTLYTLDISTGGTKADACDPDEMCPGMADQACPVDFFEPATTVCNAGSGDVCDPDETCSGVEGETCPPDFVEPDGTSCPDGDICNGDETCSGGSCELGTPLSCDDLDECTADSCDEVTGCSHAPILPCPPAIPAASNRGRAVFGLFLLAVGAMALLRHPGSGDYTAKSAITITTGGSYPRRRSATRKRSGVTSQNQEIDDRGQTSCDHVSVGGRGPVSDPSDSDWNRSRGRPDVGLDTVGLLMEAAFG